jgi:hypothetical protein
LRWSNFTTLTRQVTLPQPTHDQLLNAPNIVSPARVKGDAGIICLIGATFLVLEGLFMAGTFIPIYVSQLGESDAWQVR